MNYPQSLLTKLKGRSADITFYDDVGVNMPRALDRLKYLMKTGKPYKDELHVDEPTAAEQLGLNSRYGYRIAPPGTHGWELAPTQKQMDFINLLAKRGRVDFNSPKYRHPTTRREAAAIISAAVEK